METTRTYKIQTLFSNLTLSVSRSSCVIQKREKIYDGSRQEAANILRYARAKSGIVSLIK